MLKLPKIRKHTIQATLAIQRLATVFSLVLALFVLMTVACNFGESTAALTAGAATTPALRIASLFPEATAGQIMTMTSPATATGSDAPLATDACTPGQTAHLSQYSVKTTIYLKTHTVAATMQTTYRNETDRNLLNIVFVVEPNRRTGTFVLTSLEGLGPTRIDKYVLNGTRLEVSLKDPLRVHCRATFGLSFVIALGDMTQARMGYLAYSDRQLNLGDWLPVIAPFVDGDWLTPKFWPEGEITVTDMADFNVTAKLDGGSDNVELIGPGQVKRIDQTTWQFDAPGLRSFTLCASASMSRLTTTNDNGIQIDLYYFTLGQPSKSPHDNSPINGPQHALDTAHAAVNLYARLYHPLSTKRLVIVEGDFPDGMEFSGLVYVGHQWFAGYDGKDDSWLTLITAHEIAHQWWYSLVTNNQALYPYLDESLAVFSELAFLENQYPALTDWWWTFRVYMYHPQGYVDSTIYDFTTVRTYINAVYLRGVQMFQEIRQMIGDEAFFAWLRAYAAQNAEKIATPIEFWAAMSDADYVRTAEIRAKYMRQPDPLHPPTPTPTGTISPAATTKTPLAQPTITATQ